MATIAKNSRQSRALVMLENQPKVRLKLKENN
jgi:hypothetical protein